MKLTEINQAFDLLHSGLRWHMAWLEGKLLLSPLQPLQDACIRH